MATKRSIGSEIKQSEPKEINPANNVDALVSDFLTELKSLSSEMEEAPPPRTVVETPPSEPEIGEEVLSDVAIKRIDQEIEESLIELERLKAEVIPIAREDLTPIPPPPSERPVFAPRRDSEPQELGRPKMFDAAVASPGLTKRRRTLLFALPVALLAVAIGSLYFFRAARTTPASKQVALAPVNAAAQSGEPKQMPPPPEASLPSETKELAPVAQANRSATTPAASANTPVQERGQSKSKPAAKSYPSGLAQARPGSFAPPSPGTKASPSVAQPQPALQSSAPGALTVPPAPAAAPANTSGTPASSPVRETPQASATPLETPPASSPPRETPPASSPVRETPPASAPPRETSPASAPPPSAGSPKMAAVIAEALVKVQPAYPPMARLQRVAGKVELEADINEKGEVVRAKAVSGPAMLRSAAEEALMKWKFKPASLNGVNIASQARVSVSFNLK
jgi:TonB family protein